MDWSDEYSVFGSLCCRTVVVVAIVIVVVVLLLPLSGRFRDPHVIVLLLRFLRCCCGQRRGWGWS